MARTDFEHTVEISALLPLVWSVILAVERWPDWTPSISRVVRLSSGPLQVGSRVRIHQPKLPPAFWRVTELIPNGSFTWISRTPGVRVTAAHAVEEITNGSRVTLSIRYEGLLGALLARWVGELNERYLALEANGLKARCVARAEKQYAQLL
jgi:hypothetical protein